MFKGMLEYMMINSVDLDFFIKGGVYIVGMCYKLGDYMFYLYCIKDYGKIWKLIIKGIDGEYFICVVWVDFKWFGLFYVGMEMGMYMFFDDGENW